MSNRLSRRSVLKGGLAVAGAGLVRGPYVMAGPAPSRKLGVAVIGADGMGGYSTDMALRENFVAMVEVQDSRIANIMKNKVKEQQSPKVYFDFRKMLDECHRDIDVVLIATPDHTHAPAAIRAIHLGKHVFVQKPLAHNIYECYALAKAAQEKKVLTQMGNQGQCSDQIRRMAEYVEAGAIGSIRETHTILGRNFGGRDGRPPSKPIPAGLHWDEWLGPAAWRDYHDGLHPFSWRNWREFGTGTIGDMACHNLNPVFWALKLGRVKRFTIECLQQTGGSSEMYTQDNVLKYEIPAHGNIAAATVYVYDHDKLKPQVMLEAEKANDRKFGEYTLFIGDKGMMGSDCRILPESKHKEFPSPPRTYPRIRGGPIEDLFQCIRNGGTPCSNFPEAATPLTAFALAGLLAQAAGVGKKLEWDVEKMQVTNNSEINRLVRREYRKGWEV